jgi:hypothetical protein
VCHRILSRGGSRGLEWGFRVGERGVGKVFDGALLDRRPGYAVVCVPEGVLGSSECNTTDYKMVARSGLR